MNVIKIYADGGCRNNQKKENIGAWAYHMKYKDKVKERAGVVKNTTNNQMELMAVIEALKKIRTTNIPIEIYVDSAYVYNGMTDWVKGWKRKGWKTANKKPVKNVDLWKKLDSLSENQNRIEWNKVKGHSNNEGNNHVDMLVNKAMDREMYQ